MVRNFLPTVLTPNDLVILDREQKPAQLSTGHSAYRPSTDTFLQTLSTARWTTVLRG